MLNFLVIFFKPSAGPSNGNKFDNQFGKVAAKTFKSGCFDHKLAARSDTFSHLIY